VLTQTFHGCVQIRGVAGSTARLAGAVIRQRALRTGTYTPCYEKCWTPWGERHWCLALQPPGSAQELAAFEYISMNHPHLVAQMFPHLAQPQYQYHYHYGYPAGPHPQVCSAPQSSGWS
jgi:hypothetical protein